MIISTVSVLATDKIRWTLIRHAASAIAVISGLTYAIPSLVQLHSLLMASNKKISEMSNIPNHPTILGRNNPLRVRSDEVQAPSLRHGKYKNHFRSSSLPEHSRIESAEFSVVGTSFHAEPSPRRTPKISPIQTRGLPPLDPSVRNQPKTVVHDQRRANQRIIIDEARSKNDIRSECVIPKRHSRIQSDELSALGASSRIDQSPNGTENPDQILVATKHLSPPAKHPMCRITEFPETERKHIRRNTSENIGTRNEVDSKRRKTLVAMGSTEMTRKLCRLIATIVGLAVFVLVIVIILIVESSTSRESYSRVYKRNTSDFSISWHLALWAFVMVTALYAYYTTPTAKRRKSNITLNTAGGSLRPRGSSITAGTDAT
eukprot:CAMPEP_0114503758 /NCGR_PEP_ID=MMETSP0109-20121206/9825_1 /TAXON_ID=29199 /ORGANISM="Chlorarachnion reptans, Strain CCCM449" /LENGTH=374 /DNA_ID=CAMNT_0001681821 /DNA_START=498 /DNA_END=1622 /DNA_ORIENTATION=+